MAKILIIFNAILSFISCLNIKKIDLKEDFYNGRYFVAQNFNVFVLEKYPTNYIKIEVESLNNKKIAISYYQKDYNFKERKQLSHKKNSISNSTIMWLNKNQINNSFYFNVECYNISNCYYDLHIYKKNYSELYIGDIYTYYVTEENKEMTFLIKILGSKYYYSVSNIRNSKISIWARGSTNINSKLEPNSFTNIIKDKYQAYLLYNNEMNVNEYYLKVEGNIGDLINVGVLIFDEDDTCPIIFEDLETEITGFFKENIFETNIFKFLDVKQNSFNQFIYDFEIDNSKDEKYILRYDEDCILVCLYFNKKYNYDEYLYSLQYLKYSREGYNLLSPLIVGKNYKITFYDGENIGLIPAKPDIDFNYLTYYAIDLYGTCNYTIYECSSYPFCHPSIISKNNSLKYNDGSYSISYTKSEYNNITPISLTQKVLLINCINHSDNLISVNFYTNKNKIFISPQITFYNYLRKNNEDNLLINLPYNNEILPDSPNAFLSLEILSGNANINFETSKLSYLETIQNNNIKSFIFRYIHKNENLLKIKANKNTIYRVFYIFEENKDKILKGQYRFPTGNNFLLEIKNNYSEYLLNFNNRRYYDNYIYFEFHPIKCKNYQITGENDNIWGKEVNLSKYNNYFYDIKSDIYNSYKIRRIDYKESCLFYVSTSRFGKYGNNSSPFFILPNNISQSYFLYDNKEISYLYYHSEIDNDLLIYFKTNISSYRYSYKYSFFFYINNNYYKSNYTYQNTSFKILSNQVKEYCKVENQFCLIKFLVKYSYDHYKDNPVIELKVTTIGKQKKQTNFWKDSFKLIAIISGSSLIFIIIIIIIVCACKKNNKNGDLLAQEVNKVSFEEERINRNKAYQNGLLY